MNMENALYQAAVKRQMAAQHVAQAPTPPAYYGQAPSHSAYYAPQAPGSSDFYAQPAPPPTPTPLAVANIGPNNWTPQDINSIVTRQEKMIEALVLRQDKMAERQDKMFEVMTKQMIEVVMKQNHQMEESAKNSQEMFKVLMEVLANNAIAPAPTPAPISEPAPTFAPTPNTTPAPAQDPAPVARRAVAKTTRSAPYKKHQPERKLMEVDGCTFGEASEYNEGKKNYRKYSCAKCERTYLSWSGLKNHFRSTHQ